MTAPVVMVPQMKRSLAIVTTPSVFVQIIPRLFAVHHAQLNESTQGHNVCDVSHGAELTDFFHFNFVRNKQADDAQDHRRSSGCPGRCMF